MSKPMARIINCNVLVLGCTGSGKTQLIKSLHHQLSTWPHPKAPTNDLHTTCTEVKLDDADKTVARLKFIDTPGNVPRLKKLLSTYPFLCTQASVILFCLSYEKFKNWKNTVDLLMLLEDQEDITASIIFCITKSDLPSDCIMEEGMDGMEEITGRLVSSFALSQCHISAIKISTCKWEPEQYERFLREVAFECLRPNREAAEAKKKENKEKKKGTITAAASSFDGSSTQNFFSRMLSSSYEWISQKLKKSLAIPDSEALDIFDPALEEMIQDDALTTQAIANACKNATTVKRAVSGAGYDDDEDELADGCMM